MLAQAEAQRVEGTSGSCYGSGLDLHVMLAQAESHRVEGTSGTARAEGFILICNA